MKTEKMFLSYLSESYLSDNLYKVYMLLFYTRDLMLRARTRDLRRYHVLPRQASVLAAVRQLGEKATPTEISRLIVRDTQTISEILNRMEKQGLIKRVKDPNNNKRVKVIATEKGVEASLLSIKRESIHNMLGSLSHQEQQHLMTCLIKLTESALQENKRLRGDLSNSPNSRIEDEYRNKRGV